MPDETDPLASEEQALIDFVSRHEALCPVCRYDLRYLTRAICPECGNALKLTVGTVSQISKAWLVMIIALLAPSGIGLISGGILLRSLQHWSLADVFSVRDLEETCALLSVIYCIACIPLSAIAVFMRRWFVRRPRNGQWIIASIFATIDTAILLFFVALLLQ